MSRVIEFQPWTMLWADSATNNGVLQNEEEWFETSGHNVAQIQAEVLQASGCSLLLQGADMPDGEWEDHDDWDSAVAGSETVNLFREAPRGTPERLYRYLRWKVVGSSSEWDLVFRFALVLK